MYNSDAILQTSDFELYFFPETNKHLIMNRLFTLLLCLCSLALSAQTVVTWTGSGDGSSWDDAANWDTNTIPAATDLVEIKDDVTVSGTATAAPAQLKIAGSSTVTLDLDLAVGGFDTDEHALIVGNNSGVVFAADRTFNFTAPENKSGINVSGGVENGSVMIMEGATVDFMAANNGINIASPLTTVTNNGTLNFTNNVKNSIKTSGTFDNNGTITITEAAGSGIQVQFGTFNNEGDITISKPANDGILVSGGATLNNGGSIIATAKDDAGSGNNAIAVGAADTVAYFNNFADGTVSLDGGMADNGRALVVDTLAEAANAGTITLSGGNESARFFSLGTFVNEMDGVIDLDDGRGNVKSGTFTNNGLVTSTRDGAALFGGDGAFLVNNAFYQYGSGSFSGGNMATIDDFGIKLHGNGVNAMDSCIVDLAEQPYEYFYNGTSIGTAEDDGRFELPANTFEADSAFLTTTIPGVEVKVRNLCLESQITSALFGPTVATETLGIYPTLVQQNALTVDLTELYDTATVWLTLSNLNGTILEEIQLTTGQAHRVDVGNLPAGTYLLAGTTPTARLLGKFVVLR